ncbi:hypothetical protein TI04_07605 [Achromatium sp. WMS2]|nr:hypothetical protein TI04_07605 [Achromatium sp. WMS2]
MPLNLLRKAINFMTGNFVLKSNSGQQWLKPRYNGLIWRLGLINVSDPLDADALWDIKVTGGDGSKAVEENSNKPEHRLRSALDCYKKTVRTGNIAGKQEQKLECFTDIVVCISNTTWDHDIGSESGTKIKGLANDLRWHHLRDFQASMPRARTPRYFIRSDDTLRSDQVVFLFGNGVFFPNTGDVPQWHVSLELDGLAVNAPLMTGIISDLHKPDDKAKNDGGDNVVSTVNVENFAIGFYGDQERLLITADGYINQVPGWKADPDTYMLIRRIADDKFEVLGDKNYFRTSSRYNHGRGWSTSIAPQKGGQRLTVNLGLAQVLNNDGKTTIIGSFSGSGKNPNIPSPYKLELQAITLPHLTENLQQWTVWLDPTGSLAKPEDIDYNPKILTQLILTKSGLWLLLPGENADTAPTKPQLIGRITKKIQIGNLDAYLLPPINTTSPGLLQCKPDSISIGSSLCILGRHDLSNGKANTATDYGKITLDQLAQPKGLLWFNKATQDADSVGNINLSRKHAKIWIEDQTLQIQALSSIGVMHLDKDGNHLDSAQADDGKVLQIQLGEHIIVGCYVLRFMNNNVTINPSNDPDDVVTETAEPRYFPVNMA